MERARYKKLDELAAWDLNKGCRKWIDQSTPARRKLKKRLRKQARARLKGVDDHYDTFEIRRDFDQWTEDKYYPCTDDGEDIAWCDYVEEQFESGTWGNYAWYECFLK